MRSLPLLAVLFLGVVSAQADNVTYSYIGAPLFRADGSPSTIGTFYATFTFSQQLQPNSSVSLVENSILASDCFQAPSTLVSYEIVLISETWCNNGDPHYQAYATLTTDQNGVISSWDMIFYYSNIYIGSSALSGDKLIYSGISNSNSTAGYFISSVAEPPSGLLVLLPIPALFAICKEDKRGTA